MSAIWSRPKCVGLDDMGKSNKMSKIAQMVTVNLQYF